MESQRASDPLWIVQPLLDHMKNVCDQLHRPTDLCLDEQMIGFTGRCPARQYVPRKSNPTGLGNVVLASSDGLILDFHLYSGKKSFGRFTLNDQPVGQGLGSVLCLVDDLPAGHNLFCDRLFYVYPSD